MKNAIGSALVATLVGLTSSGTATAALLNGSFETPALPGGGAQVSVAPAGFNWTIASGDIDILTSSYWQPSSGLQSLDLNGSMTGSIYQDFTFSSAGTWTIQFDMSANPDVSIRGDGGAVGLRTMRLDFGTPGLMNVLGTYSVDSAPRSVGNMQWVTMTSPQITVSDSVVYRLQFTSLSSGVGGPALDNVQLIPVPEPSSIALMCVGWMGYFLFRPRNRN